MPQKHGFHGRFVGGGGSSGGSGGGSLKAQQKAQNKALSDARKAQANASKKIGNGPVKSTAPKPVKGTKVPTTPKSKSPSTTPHAPQGRRVTVRSGHRGQSFILKVAAQHGIIVNPHGAVKRAVRKGLR